MNYTLKDAQSLALSIKVLVDEAESLARYDGEAADRKTAQAVGRANRLAVRLSQILAEHSPEVRS